MKYDFSKLKKFIINFQFKPFFLDFIKWKLIDVYRFFKYPKKVHLYGIRCITGMYGHGKTVTMSYLAYKLRKKYGDKIYICSNYGLLIQDFAFTSTDQLIQQYDKPIVFFWDEVQNDFPSSDKNFPSEVRKALTLNRKGNGKMFYWASQDHELVHKTIRRLTIQYGQVRTLLGRRTRIKWYTKLDYENLVTQTDVKKCMKIHPIKKEKFIQTDFIRSLYDSFAWDNGEKLTINVKK